MEKCKYIFQKKWILIAIIIMTFALSGCGTSEEVSTSPQNLSFNVSNGSFSFDAIEGADTYLVGVSKIINASTGEILEGINGAVLTEIAEGNSEYLWSEQSGSATGIADNDRDGVISGTVVFREFSNSATTVGAVLSMTELPLGHYIVQAMAASNEEIQNPEPAYYEFTVGGTLESPEGFVAQINEQGNIQITAPNNYYFSCLTSTGLPNKIIIEVSDGTSVVDTIEISDFSYTNEVLGPTKSYNFTNQTVTGTAVLDTSIPYSIKVTAKGDGGEILDSSAAGYMATSTESTEFATLYDTYGEATVGVFDLKLLIGLDVDGNQIYELDASVNGVDIYKEFGTYETEAAVELIDELTTYPEGVILTFYTSKSDIGPVLDGATMNVVIGASMGGGMPPVTNTVYNLAAEGLSMEGNQVNFEASVASMGF